MSPPPSFAAFGRDGMGAPPGLTFAHRDSARLTIGPIDCFSISYRSRQSHPMNLRDLEYVIAVADHGSFSRAAEACNVSQPTLSGQIIKLEAEFGLSLFERSGRAVRVHDRAAGVIAEARAALAAAANVAAAARASRDPFEGPLRVGIIATVAPYLLPAALPAAAKALPQ